MSTQVSEPAEEVLALSRRLPADRLITAKEHGFSDLQIAHIFSTTESTVQGLRKHYGINSVFKTVDTCAAEFDAKTPYHYSTYDEENESVSSDRKKVIILGGGPNRIGQGIEFDYCCVQAVFALREAGYETIMVNCNPETVSTDYDIADKLYFEPLTFEDTIRIIEHEKPLGVIVSFGGQTPLKLSGRLHEAGVTILGTSSEGIDLAEDRKKFGALLDRLNIPHPDYGTAVSLEEARDITTRIGYPVLVRPSYVLGGRAMKIIYSDDSLKEYVDQALFITEKYPLLIDRFLETAVEFDIDALADTTDCVISGIMQHVEAAGIHSGDSTSILPYHNISPEVIATMKEYTRIMAENLKVVGLMNVQYAVQNNSVYVIEVNPRASRTVPFVGKATAIPVVKIATRIMLGEKLSDLRREFDLKDCDELGLKHMAIKEPVFPFSKFVKSGVYLGPEMRSTGEAMSLAEKFPEAFAKAYQAANMHLPLSGSVFISVNNQDKNNRILDIARSLYRMDFDLVATEGTHRFLCENGIECKKVFKVGEEGRPNIFDIIKHGKIDFVINTPRGEQALHDEEAIGAASVLSNVPFVTTIEAAEASVQAIDCIRHEEFGVKSLQEYAAYRNKP
ncbi:carbamoyl-phosphate synthase large subunit [Chlorobium phaeovibrioides]|uniref:Carbamoyl-phosphate synthase large subunit n=2 Tax=Chlorobium phaeovibrioides TaxID=1094 RepID=A0A3S0LQ63_CHLPH|nr:carbamoyl-phosphate synthase large subunit [Chlorobium phaeovibrioides]KAA6233012.1 carbamoyl-phosphate synthase large subunit [Chlorobium phaeovibrioides]MWV53889.1 carbamoyl-phosphate synthase large subunit [Chlorobium phaeovibrioides]RTY38783.1 carbamoyl-phosphate synthase large subunit [Chlorobium phaeovibrioides]HCD36108.1 carbamoyl-phosphate synthase large subunit [Chlorobium sp.]